RLLFSSCAPRPPPASHPLSLHDALPIFADIRQCPGDDHAHRVVQVGPLHLQLQVHLLHAVGQDLLVVLGRSHIVSHRKTVLTQTSRKRTSRALRWMKERRDSTSSPISTAKISSTAAASPMVTWRSVRVSGFIVVSHSSR